MAYVRPAIVNTNHKLLRAGPTADNEYIALPIEPYPAGTPTLVVCVYNDHPTARMVSRGFNYDNVDPLIGTFGPDREIACDPGETTYGLFSVSSNFNYADARQIAFDPTAGYTQEGGGFQHSFPPEGGRYQFPGSVTNFIWNGDGYEEVQSGTWVMEVFQALYTDIGTDPGGGTVDPGVRDPCEPGPHPPWPYTVARRPRVSVPPGGVRRTRRRTV